MFNFFKKRIGLALGGGAARGLAHLGVLKVFEKFNFIPDLIVGTSMGAIVGAAVASKNFKSIDDLISKFNSILKSEQFEKLESQFLALAGDKKAKNILQRLKNLTKKIILYEKILNDSFLIPISELEKVLRLFLPYIDIENLPVKFATVSLDLNSGKRIILNRGSLIKAVMASCAIPGIFQPLNYQGYLLIDGGWIEKVPAISAKLLGAKKVIAVDVSSSPKKEFRELKSGISFLIYADEITNNELKNMQIKIADVVISPLVSNEVWANFRMIDDFVKAGESATFEKIKEIKKLFKKFF